MLFSVAILFVIGFLVPVISALAQITLAAFVALTLFEFIMLYRIRDGITVDRLVPNRLSNGDENVITLSIFNNYAFNCRLEIIDELPPQFQIRNFSIRLGIDSGKAIKRIIHSDLPSVACTISDSPSAMHQQQLALYSRSMS